MPQATNDASGAPTTNAPAPGANAKTADTQTQTAVASANGYTDQQTREALQSAQTYSDAANAQTLAAANAYTNQALEGYVTTDAFSQFESQVNSRFAEVDKRIDQIGAAGVGFHW